MEKMGRSMITDYKNKMLKRKDYRRKLADSELDTVTPLRTDEESASFIKEPLVEEGNPCIKTR
jgi:hypothetical protein